MSKKRTLLSICAILLICVICVSGTLAYMTGSTNEVTNTFIAAGDGKLCESIELKEHAVTSDGKGGYTIASDAEEVDAAQYTVIPGTSVSKDPFIRVKGKTAAPAYIYVEVVNTTKTVTFTMDANWTALTGVTGTHGGTVYVWENAVQTTTGNQTYNIISDKKVNIADATQENPLTFAAGSDTLTFYGYIAQATVTDSGTTSSDPTTVFNTCFASTT